MEAKTLCPIIALRDMDPPYWDKVESTAGLMNRLNTLRVRWQSCNTMEKDVYYFGDDFIHVYF